MQKLFFSVSQHSDIGELIYYLQGILAEPQKKEIFCVIEVSEVSEVSEEAQAQVPEAKKRKTA